MTHEEARDLLDAWLDNELDPAATSRMDRHVEECARCTARVDERQRLNALLNLPGVTHVAPPTAELALSRVAGRPRALGPFQATWPKALAASVLVGFAAFWFGMRREGARVVEEEIVAAHVRAGLSSTPIDVQSSDHHTVKPWFAQRLPFSPPVPEVVAGGDALIGGRVDVLERQRVAVLVYRHGNHRVDVFIAPASPSFSGVRSALGIEGFNVLGGTWRDFDIAWVSDTSPDELERFRERWLRDATTQSAAPEGRR